MSLAKCWGVRGGGRKGGEIGRLSWSLSSASAVSKLMPVFVFCRHQGGDRFEVGVAFRRLVLKSGVIGRDLVRDT